MFAQLIFSRALSNPLAGMRLEQLRQLGAKGASRFFKDFRVHHTASNMWMRLGIIRVRGTILNAAQCLHKFLGSLLRRQAVLPGLENPKALVDHLPADLLVKPSAEIGQLPERLFHVVPRPQGGQGNLLRSCSLAGPNAGDETLNSICLARRLKPAGAACRYPQAVGSFCLIPMPLVSSLRLRRSTPTRFRGTGADCLWRVTSPVAV